MLFTCWALGPRVSGGGTHAPARDRLGICQVGHSASAPLTLTGLPPQVTASTLSHGKSSSAAPGGGVPAPVSGLPVGELNFLVLGDYGRQGFFNQSEVAASMGVTASQVGTSFVIAVGDNVYSNGIANVSDPLWAATMNNVYTHPALTSVPWYAVTGNHDWHGNITAQFDGKALGFPTWRCDMSYDVKGPNSGVTHHGNGLLDVFYIDTDVLSSRRTSQLVTNGFVTAAQAANSTVMDAWYAGWENRQVARLQRLLAASSARWKMVVGHHGIYSYGCDHGPYPQLARLNGALRAGGAHAYFCGHDHDLIAMRLPAGDPISPLYILSGAGSQCRNDVADPGDGSLLYGYGWAGYTHVALTHDAMTTVFLDRNGAVLYTTTTAWVPPPTCADPASAASDSRCSVPVPPNPCTKR